MYHNRPMSLNSLIQHLPIVSFVLMFNNTEQTLGSYPSIVRVVAEYCDKRKKEVQGG